MKKARGDILEASFELGYKLTDVVRSRHEGAVWCVSWVSTATCIW